MGKGGSTPGGTTCAVGRDCGVGLGAQRGESDLRRLRNRRKKTPPQDDVGKFWILMKREMFPFDRSEKKGCLCDRKDFKHRVRSTPFQLWLPRAIPVHNGVVDPSRKG